MMRFGIQEQNEAETKLAKARTLFYTFWSVVAVCLLTVLAVLLLRVISLPVGVVIWSVIIVFCLRGVVNALEERGTSRIWGTAIAYVLMFAVVALILLLMFSPMFGVNDQFKSLVESLPEYVSGIFAWVNGLYDRYSFLLSNETLRGYISALASSLGEWATSLARNSASSVFAFSAGAVNLAIIIAFALVIAFWILLELPRMGAECRRLAGERYQETLTMLHLTFTRVLGGYIKGTLLQCTIIGVLSWLLFLVLGIPNAAALGVISGVMNIIPVVGPWLGGALAALVGIFISPWIALVAFIGSGIIQHGVYNLVSPIIMRNAVDIHPVLTIMSILIASAIGGVMSGGVGGAVVGMLIAIPVVAVAKSIFVYYFEKRTGRRIVSPDGVFFKGDAAGTEDDVDPMSDAVSLRTAASSADSSEEKGLHQTTDRAIATARALLSRDGGLKEKASMRKKSRIVVQQTDVVVLDESDLVMVDDEETRKAGEEDAQVKGSDFLIAETQVVKTTFIEEASDDGSDFQVFAFEKPDNK